MNFVEQPSASPRPRPVAPAPGKSKNPLANTFYSLQLVVVAAFILATLFTAWESNNILSGEPNAFQPAGTPGSGQAAINTPRLNRIGVVAGHYGNDSGAVCADGLTEAELNLNVATRVQKTLAAQGFDVDLLKEFDTRLKGYRGLSLIFIHSDSCLYINDLATGFKVAAATTSTQPDKSARLASCVRGRYNRDTGLPFHSGSITVDMTNYHAFEDIDPETPAAIIEIGFMNLDRQMLTEHQDRIAQGIIDGIMCYLNNESIQPTAQPSVQPSAQPTQAPAGPTP